MVNRPDLVCDGLINVEHETRKLFCKSLREKTHRYQVSHKILREQVRFQIHDSQLIPRLAR